ncbi:TPA: hypothetical protein EYP66_02670 [Candidatus Poribacteria bacterium]|nr:hypothetical protein [Candidatus Poribacteria bacterium]
MIRDLTDVRAEAVMQRHATYWQNGEWYRPLFRISQAQTLGDTPNPHYLEPPPPLDAKSFRDGIERSYDSDGLLSDDLIRMVGTGITSEALVVDRVAIRAGTSWAEPCFRDWHQFDNYKVKDTIWFQRLMDNTKRAVDAVDTNKYPFSCMAFRGPVDMAEAVMKGERLCAAVIDHPNELKNMLARITDIIIETGLAHSELLPSYKGGYFNSYGLWTPGRTITLTFDGGCLFSPACYEEFFLPQDIRICEAFDTPFVHLHAASRQHFLAWRDIPNLGLQCVIDQAWLPENVNQPIGPQLEELLPLFKKIREKKSLMLYGFFDEKLLELALKELPPGGSAITGLVEEPDAIRQKYVKRENQFGIKES